MGSRTGLPGMVLLAGLFAAGLFVAGPAQAVDGPGLYRQHCAKCHGAGGKADSWRGRLSFAQDFTEATYQAGNDDADILRKINRGPRIMPAYEERLTLAERQALVQVVRGFGKP